MSSMLVTDIFFTISRDSEQCVTKIRNHMLDHAKQYLAPKRIPKVEHDFRLPDTKLQFLLCIYVYACIYGCAPAATPPCGVEVVVLKCRVITEL